MSIKSTNPIYIPVAAILISAISFVLSFLTYNRNSPENELKREQDEKMQIIASRTIVVFKQLQKISELQEANIQAKDVYFIPFYQKNIERLENSLDEAIGLGLFHELVGDSTDALEMNVKFREGLFEILKLDSKDSNIEEWTRQHFFWGIIRLLDQCTSYRKNLIPAELSKEINERIGPKKSSSSLKEKAWSYLKNKEFLNK